MYARRLPKNRPPTHPGEILEKDFLQPLGMTQTELADRLDVQFKRINQIVNQRRRVTPETALLLARAFGTTAEFWLNLQTARDLWEVKHGETADRLERVDPVEVSGGEG